jgi:hypothetical protein
MERVDGKLPKQEVDRPPVTVRLESEPKRLENPPLKLQNNAQCHRGYLGARRLITHCRCPRDNLDQLALTSYHNLSL